MTERVGAERATAIFLGVTDPVWGGCAAGCNSLVGKILLMWLFSFNWLSESLQRHVQHHGGQLAEVDFFEVTVDMAGERRKVWMLVIRLMDSGRDFAWLYDRCDRIALLGCPPSSRILHPILIVASHAPESRQGRCTLN
jgi:hypothetical protein